MAKNINKLTIITDVATVRDILNFLTERFANGFSK